MPLFLRKLQHAVVVRMMKLFAGMAPSTQHRVFLGSGSSRHLCEHIVRSGVTKLLVVTDKPLRELGVVLEDRADGTIWKLG